jgi:CheY-like chemotaxis protein
MFAADLLREEAGFKVIEAVNADEALTVLEATADVRALVTDVEMPGSLDGFTLARLVSKAWPQIGIVVVSARSGPGPNDLPPGARFVAKPYSTTALIDAVRGAVRQAEPQPIVVPKQEPAPAPAPAFRSPPAYPLLPAGLKLDKLDTGIGNAGGLAQPLAEPED